ncbi:dnaJ homolog subfamily C member 7-like [Mya arenaria]|uniref:dnaJ homolog subfamily C member 7-like n=1 Tax=Mya arenaria TaxID=6604 RepID=UPI0022E7BB22|nr:dnaJ homolog subfamily C member 7-like [Mya arenaria]
MSDEENNEAEPKIMEIDEQIVVRTPEEMKEMGNQYYKEKNYTEAISCYTQAINLCPNCAAYYGNRSACYMMLNKYSDALEDARNALRIDSTFVKGHLREGKCQIVMGDPSAAIRSYNTALELDPENKTAQTELRMAQQMQNCVDTLEKDLEKNDFRKALFVIDQCLKQAPACVRFKIQRAEVLTFLGRYQESQELANDVLQREGMNPDALYVRGMCLYYQDNIDKAFQHFQQVLRLAPDHQKAKDTYKKAKQLISTKEEGNKEFRSGKFNEAYNSYTAALSIDPNNKFTNSKLYCNRATVCTKIGKLEQSVDDCSAAIDLDNTYIKAYMRRAKSYMDLEKYEEAVRDYEKICQLDKTRENKQLLQNAKLELKKSKRKDYYKILGVHKTASEDEIKKAYRKRALVHHPDRHSHDTPEKQKEEEVTFKEVGEAYSVLSDQKKRQRYDTGQDLEEMDGYGPGFHDFDPNLIFQSFFSQGGGQSYGAGGGGFPGGFSFQFG